MEAPTKIQLDEVKHLIASEYAVLSHLGEIEGNRFCQPIFGKLFLTNEQGDREKEIGSLTAFKILLGNAMDARISAFDIFDMEGDRFDLGETIFADFSKYELHPAIVKHFEDDFNWPDILVLESIEIDADYRGSNLGKYLVKDFCNNFKSGVQLVIADFRNCPDNERLIFYFKRIGFDSIPAVSKTLMFLNPAFNNPGMDEIILD